jgi:hypothetical protein
MILIFAGLVSLLQISSRIYHSALEGGDIDARI